MTQPLLSLLNILSGLAGLILFISSIWMHFVQRGTVALYTYVDAFFILGFMIGLVLSIIWIALFVWRREFLAGRFGLYVLAIGIIAALINLMIYFAAGRS